MNRIYLPTLISINIKNFSLYPNGLNLKYNFKNGLNLFIGGNGTGKTTLTKLIKYAIIGHYREMTDLSVYMGERREKRSEYPKNYYKSRMDSSFSENSSAEITIDFKINETQFSVTRNIYEIKLTKAEIVTVGRTKDINGIIISQDKYEKLTLKEKKECMQYKYEEEITRAAGLSSFDGMIFFVNEILYFGEDRKLILWDWRIQEELSSKYFNDPKLDRERTNLLLDQKNEDTLARHTSEEIKAIRDAIYRIESKENINEEKSSSYKKINDLKKQVEQDEKKIATIQQERSEMVERRRYLNSSRMKITQEITTIENLIRIEENNVHDKIWRSKNPRYETYQKHILNNHSCPMCNQELSKQEITEILINDSDCFLCRKPIRIIDKKNPKLKELEKDLEKLLISKRNSEKEIVDLEVKITELDSTYNKLDIELFNLKDQIRNLDLEINKSQEGGTKKSPNDFKYKLELEIKALEERKKEHQYQSKRFADQIFAISRTMNDKKASILIDLSYLFSDFVEKFLGLKCILTSDDVIVEKGRKLRVYLPIVNNESEPRRDPEEFSESQRFFVDLAFRMSLLNYFYNKPTFFICETPDSSLDISYERNAANLFLEYLKKKNALIITSNFNNSEFLSYLSEKAPAVNYLNLLNIGRVSEVQKTSKILETTSKKFEKIIHGK